MQHVLGIVTIVQEGRFRLATPDGRSLHFVLGHQAKTAAQDIADLCARMAPVRVAFDTIQGRSNLVAHQVCEPGVHSL